MNIVQFKKFEYPIIKKKLDNGEEIECVDIDSLTEEQFKQFCRNTGSDYFVRTGVK